MCVAPIACCGLQARDKGQIHAQGTNSPRRSRRWPSLGRWTSFWGAPRTSWLLTICDCFAVLSRVEWISVELIGCKTRSRLQKRSQLFVQLQRSLQPRYCVRRARYHSQNEWYF
jgi:hypothetical protein